MLEEEEEEEKVEWEGEKENQTPLQHTSSPIEEQKTSLPTGLTYTPKPYEAPEETLLAIDFELLVEEDEAKREKSQFLICTICMKVVNHPVECSSCDTPFCALCIEPWAAKNDSCPKKCRGNDAITFKQLNRYVAQELNEMKFKCMN